MYFTSLHFNENENLPENTFDLTHRCGEACWTEWENVAKCCEKLSRRSSDKQWIRYYSTTV